LLQLCSGQHPGSGKIWQPGQASAGAHGRLQQRVSVDRFVQQGDNVL
jgi:hypothetical protein